MSTSYPGKNPYLILGGLFSMTFAVFQISAIFWNDELLKFFGGPVTMRAESPLVYILACVFIGIVVALFGLYAFSGAGKFRRLPFLRTMLIIFTVLLILRGGKLYIDVKLMNAHPGQNLLRFAVFSVMALCAGLVHLFGVIRLFRGGRGIARTA